MQAYTVHKILTNNATGEVEVHFTFAIPECEPVNRTRIFKSKLEAFDYLHRDKYTWFKVSLEYFLLQPLNCSNDKSVIKAQEFYDSLCKKEHDLTKTCQSFLRGIEHFTNLLPPTDMPEHSDRQQDLRELIKFCDQETTAA